ncbi:hypothetical protein [Glacieibacterium sp.]|uniref:hypothetical protein n=1 Tax=Glacieibacterium sp. TaxID=2860237 RepID=UPI003AFF720A
MFASIDTATPSIGSYSRPVARRAETGSFFFTSLEQRVLRLAVSGSERPSTSVEGRIRRISRRIGNIVMARRGGAELADPRLEALRSYAASIHAGTSTGLPLFYAAGYTNAHADAVKRFVAAEQRLARHRPSRSDSAIYASGISLGIASIMGFVAMTGSLLAGM